MAMGFLLQVVIIDDCSLSDAESMVQTAGYNKAWLIRETTIPYAGTPKTALPPIVGTIRLCDSDYSLVPTVIKNARGNEAKLLTKNLSQ